MNRTVKLVLGFLSVGILSATMITRPRAHVSTNTAPRTTAANISTARGKALEFMSKEQGDAILWEVRQTRRLLEKQQGELALLSTPPATETPQQPETIEISVHADWRSIGSADAPVTVVEYTDYECPFCKQFHLGAFSDLKRNYVDTGKVRWVSHDLPLDIHPHAMKAAQAARCAGEQNKFWELRDALLSSDTPPEDNVIEKSAERLALNMENFQTCLDSEKFKTDVRKDAAEAAALQIGNTPTFVVAKSALDKLDGVRIVGSQPLATFRSAIDALLDR